MDSKPVTVLFVNHLQENCGVYQYFKRSTQPVVDSLDTYHYIQTNSEWEYDHWVNVLQPQIVVYNFYFSGATMPWLTNDKIQQQKPHRKQLSIYHEGNIDDKGFDLILHQNPINEDPKYFTLPRHIPEYKQPLLFGQSLLPTVGTFGFGLGGKGFTRVVEQVMSEYDQAIIRMNIPYAYFGDADGSGARWWETACQAIAAKKPEIELRIGHSLLPDDQLLDFLAGNDINCFFYDDNYGRGISSTLDYALAVNRPIAITKSWQFQHMWNDKHFIENNTLRGLIQQGTQHLQQYHDKWNNTTLIQAYNNAFDRVLGR